MFKSSTFDGIGSEDIQFLVGSTIQGIEFSAENIEHIDYFVLHTSNGSFKISADGKDGESSYSIESFEIELVDEHNDDSISESQLRESKFNSKVNSNSSSRVK